MGFFFFFGSFFCLLFIFFYIHAYYFNRRVPSFFWFFCVLLLFLCSFTLCSLLPIYFCSLTYTFGTFQLFCLRFRPGFLSLPPRSSTSGTCACLFPLLFFSLLYLLPSPFNPSPVSFPPLCVCVCNTLPLKVRPVLFGSVG